MQLFGTKDYQTEIRRFISGQHLYTGLRVTACVIIPAWLLYHYGLLSTLISIPLGALFVGLTDNPGPVQHRRNGLLISSCLNFIVVLIAGMTRFSPWLVGLEIISFGILFSLISVYGARASSIGLTALIVFILSIDNRFGTVSIFQVAFYYLIGGLYYTAVSLSLYTLRPFRPIQQLLGECLMKTSSYLATKSRFYEINVDSSEIVTQLIEQQVRIHEYQEQLRSILFTTRRFLSESTHKGRILTMMFRESLDLFERTITSQQEYGFLHRHFDGTGILDNFRITINQLAEILYDTGLAIQEGREYQNEEGMMKALQESADAFQKLRMEKLNAENVEAFIKLRRILNSLYELADRIKQVGIYTSYDTTLSSRFQSNVDFSRFATHQEINIDLVRSNLSLGSSSFRHALRLTIALLLGYIISLFFPLGHGYWILLTIATIIKPAYSLTRKRNIQRLSGTFAGAVIGFLVLLISPNNTVIFIIMIAMMILAYSLLRVNYAVSIAGLTIYLLLSFHFMYPSGLNTLLIDRVIDTAIGSVIAYLIAYFVLPAWQHEQIDKLITQSFRSDRQYFLTVAKAFTGHPPDETSYKIARKDAFVTLANLSDTFQRMLSDPKNQQPNLPLYQQIVANDHMLTSHVATLSHYAQQYGTVYQHSDFQPLISMIEKTFDEIEKEESDNATQSANEMLTNPVLKKVRRLIDQRKKDLQQGLDTSSVENRKMLSDLVTITDQFRLIHSLVADAGKIWREINSRVFIQKKQE